MWSERLLLSSQHPAPEAQHPVAQSTQAVSQGNENVCSSFVM